MTITPNQTALARPLRAQPQRGTSDERGMRQWFLGRKDCMRRLVLRAGAEGAAHVTNPTTVLVLQSQQASRFVHRVTGNNGCVLTDALWIQYASRLTDCVLNLENG